MSKYTTEVRFICESKAGMLESVGFSKVDEVISKSWDKIFTSKCRFFDEGYRQIICSKILKHYYTREIAGETVGLWMLWLNQRLEEIMPYYNKLYESELLKFEPLKDVDYTREGSRDGTQDKTGNRTSNQEVSGTSNFSNTNKDLYSDTPQGGINGIENETYLTNARKVSDSGNSSDSGTTNLTDNSKVNNVSTETYLEHISGKMGATNYSKMLMDFRDTFLNIDKMVIDEFSDLFFGLW